jgi:hypothetical protein
MRAEGFRAKALAEAALSVLGNACGSRMSSSCGPGGPWTIQTTQRVQIMQPAVVHYAAAKSIVKGLEKNKQGELVVDGNIYVDALCVVRWLHS